MLSRWPLYLSQTPAAEIVSVVHLPLTLYRTLSPVSSLSPNGVNGSSKARRSEVGEMAISASGEGLSSPG